MAKHAEHYIPPTLYLERVYRIDHEGTRMLVAEGMHPGPKAIAAVAAKRFPDFTFEVITERIGAR